MTAALKLPKGFDAADALALGLTAETIRKHIRIVSATTPPKPTAPTYPDFGVPVVEAEEPNQRAIANFFRIDRSREETSPIQIAVVTGVAAGKTEVVIENTIKAVMDGLNGVIFVPQHRLSVDLANRINAMAGSVISRVWFGIEQEDPSSPGQAMCRIVETAVMWQKAGGSLSDLCKECPHRTVCGYLEQKADKSPKVWILPSNMASKTKPSNISKPDFVIFDESPTQNWVAGLDSDYAIAPDKLLEDRVFPPRKGDTRLELSAVTRDILLSARIALSASNAGPLRRSVWEKFNIGRLRDVAKLEWTLATPLPKPDHLNLGAEVFLTQCKQAANDRAVIAKRWRFWTLLADFLESGQEVSPNLTITDAQNILMAWRDDVDESWSNAPTMLLDATLNEPITRQWFPRLEVVASVKLEAPHCTRTQITDVPLAGRQWNPDPDAANYATRRNNADRLARFLEVKANEFRGQGADDIDILFVGQKSLVEYLREVHGTRLGERVALEWQNNLRGIDTYKGVRCQILAGRLLPGPSALERRAGVIFGKMPDAIHPDKKGMIWYPKVEEPNRFLRMKDGFAVGVKNPIHPDPNVQEVLEQICHAELLQCEGRARANRRTADNPLDVFILTDVCLDLTIDQAIDHKTLLAQGAGFQLMQARGIVPEGWTEIALILGHSDGESARMWFSRHPEESAMLRTFLTAANVEHSPIGAYIGKCSTFDGWSRYQVRRAGSRKSAWVWIRGDDPAAMVHTFLGGDYVLLSDVVPVSASPASAPVQADPPTPKPLPTAANDAPTRGTYKFDSTTVLFRP